MTYEELVTLAQETYGKADASKVKEHVAIQFDVAGEASGAFYIEIKDGKVEVQPYQYFDRDVIVTIDGDNLVKIAEGKLGLEAAYFTGKLKAEGNLGKALLLKDVEVKMPEKKAAKKPAAKKTTAKAATKTAAKTTEKATAKTAEKKPAAKTTAKKTTK